MNTDRMREELSSSVGQAVMTAIAVTMQNNPDRERIPAAVHLGCNVALTALVPIVPFLAKRPSLSPEEAKKQGPDELVKLMTYERLLFAALIVARMQGDVRVANYEVTKDGMHGCDVSQEVNFGPYVLGQALEDWKKVTGKDPTEYLDKSLLRAIEQCERESLAPFEDFLKGRHASPSSGTLQ